MEREKQRKEKKEKKKKKKKRKKERVAPGVGGVAALGRGRAPPAARRAGARQRPGGAWPEWTGRGRGSDPPPACGTVRGGERESVVERGEREKLEREF